MNMAVFSYFGWRIIGTDGNICSHVLIEGDVTIGDRVTDKSCVQLWDSLRVGDDVLLVLM